MPKEITVMPFGKYRGRLLEKTPNSYLKYASENFDNMSDELHEAINIELAHRDQFDIFIKDNEQ